MGIASSCEPGALPGAASGDFALLRAHHAPFGCPLHVLADHPALLDALAQALAGWEGDAAELRRPLRIELRMSDTLYGADAPRFAADEYRLRIEGAGVIGLADARRGVATAQLSHELARDAVALREVIEPLALFLLAGAGRVPIHSAGVVVGDVALLLAGPSGSGKSCLALAAQALGLGVLTDDIVYLQTRPALRPWTLPRPLHVFAEDAPAPGGAIRVRNGKHKQAIPLAGPARPVSAIALVLLERGAQVGLQPIARTEAEAGFARLEPGFDLWRAEILDAIGRIAEAGAWRLTLSADPPEAIAALVRRLPEIRRRAVAC